LYSSGLPGARTFSERAEKPKGIACRLKSLTADDFFRSNQYCFALQPDKNNPFVLPSNPPGFWKIILVSDAMSLKSRTSAQTRFTPAFPCHEHAELAISFSLCTDQSCKQLNFL
jgi:hypothetical protein